MTSVHLDRKTPRVRALDLREHDAQETVAVGGLGLLHVDDAGQRHVAPERPVGALDRVMAVTLELALDSLFALDAQRVVDDSMLKSERLIPGASRRTTTLFLPSTTFAAMKPQLPSVGSSSSPEASARAPWTGSGSAPRRRDP